MKTLILLALAAPVLTSCDVKVDNSDPPSKTTVVTPAPKEEKKVEHNTTIVNPPPVKEEKKVETNTTIIKEKEEKKP